MTSAMFITPKQKKLMKERKKKKKLFQAGAIVSENNNSTEIISPKTPSLPNLSNNNNNKKRPRSVDNDDHDDSNIPSNVLENETKNSKNINNDKSSKMPNKYNKNKNDVTVIIPSDLSTKEIKKFRKDARRKAREDGKDENQIIFIDQKTIDDEKNKEPVKKKQKFTFPCIKQIVELEKLNKEKNTTVIESNNDMNSNHVSNVNNDINDTNITDTDKSKYIAIDCEMVGIGPTSKQSALARISCVDWDCNVLLDTYVKVPGKVTDFRTWVSGIKPKHIKSHDAMELNDVRNKVCQILKNKILVGHALKNDIDALLISHPKENIRDTSKYRIFQRKLPNSGDYRSRKLRDLVKEHCNILIQQPGESHDSIDDAKATMELFKTVQSSWERELNQKLLKQQKKNNKKKPPVK